MPDFNFNLSVSTTDSGSKPTNKDIARLKYLKQSVSIGTFIKYIKQGRSFCYCFDDMDEMFGNSVKTVSKFRYTNVIAIDIDDSTVPMSEYVGGLKHTPTIAYTTYSNGIKGYRFRLVYVFTDKIVGVDNYVSAYNAILSVNEMEMKDNCMRAVNQCFIGNGSPNVEVFNSGVLYSLTDFAFKAIMCASLSLNYNHKCKTAEGDRNVTGIAQSLNPEFAENLSNMLPSDFIDHYRREYDYFDHSQLILSEDETHYQYPADYREVRREWEDRNILTITGERKRVRTIHIRKDGEKRRKTLFNTAIVIKSIKPDITIEHLVYILCVERYHYYDNSDKQLTNNVLIDIARSAIKGDYKSKESSHGAFKVNKAYWAAMGLSANSAARKVGKMLNHQSIGEWYDCSKSVKENAEYAAEHNIKKAKLRTLYVWCRENGVPTNPKLTNQQESGSSGVYS